jgi:hypothetical protein
MPAATTNVATSSSATATPPAAVNSAAPASGATSRSPSRAVCMMPLASASSSAPRMVASSAEPPAPSTLNEKPYTAVTA